MRELARELDADLNGARLRAIRLDGRTRDALFLFRDRTMVWRLHPEHGYPTFADPIEPEPEDLRIRARVRSVRAPADERILIIELAPERSGTGAHELVIELLGNRMNAVVTRGPERVVRHLLRTPGGKRPLRVGHPYVPPTMTARNGANGDVSAEAWSARLAPVPPPERRGALLETFAWVSPLNVDHLLAQEDLGHDLWRGLAKGDRESRPVVRETRRGPQPYPYPFGEVRETASLMAAIAEVIEAQGVASAPAALGLGPALLERLEAEVARADRKVVRLTAQFDGREDPASARAVGDLILARFGEIRPGLHEVELTDFEGRSVRVELDPSLPPHENANRYYTRATRAERTAERLPKLIAGAEKDRDRLHALLADARAGAVDAEAVRAVLPARQEGRSKGASAPALPYRSFRSSGGLEIRVGKGAKHNDALTFHHSAPDDVWLHARHMAGAHVILRWTSTDNPPGRDLEEAAALAALFSKARTSGSAPVDWTRRKYVRKPRKAPPGSVLADRISTVFVVPDESLIERLGADGNEGD